MKLTKCERKVRKNKTKNRNTRSHLELINLKEKANADNRRNKLIHLYQKLTWTTDTERPTGWCFKLNNLWLALALGSYQQLSILCFQLKPQWFYWPLPSVWIVTSHGKMWTQLCFRMNFSNNTSIVKNQRGVCRRLIMWSDRSFWSKSTKSVKNGRHPDCPQLFLTELCRFNSSVQVTLCRTEA